jgi:hypothetical protein
LTGKIISLAARATSRVRKSQARQLQVFKHYFPRRSDIITSLQKSNARINPPPDEIIQAARSDTSIIKGKLRAVGFNELFGCAIMPQKRGAIQHAAISASPLY